MNFKRVNRFLLFPIFTLIYLLSILVLYNFVNISTVMISDKFMRTSKNLNTLSDQIPPRYGNLDQDSLSSSLISHSENVSSEMFQVEKEMEKRRVKVQNLCEQYHLGKYNNGSTNNVLGIKEPPTPLYSYFFWNVDRNLAWCPVYKAGSTSWLYNMMILKGVSEKVLKNPAKQLSVLARETYGEIDETKIDETMLKNTLKLLIVRHPFHRLLSAYLDKLSNSSVGQEHGTLHFYKKYGRKIVQKYRKIPNQNQKEPTWEEFISYILSTDLLHYSDDHWLPVYYSCTPCLLQYDVIAKVETFNRDQAYIIWKLGLEGVLKPKWNHKSDNDYLVQKYFGKLKKHEILRLHEKYKLDFDLFGYEYEEFLNYGLD